MYPDTNSTNNQPLSSIFQWMPTCALVIDLHGIIQEINQKAIHFFRATTKEDFIFDKQNIKNMIIDSHRATDLIKSISKSLDTTNNEILIRRFDKTIAGVDLYACLLPDNPNLILIQFNEKKPFSKVYMHEVSQAFRREAQRLKPYLNKPGKNILEEIIITDIVDGLVSNNISKKNQAVTISEEHRSILVRMFPKFSDKELILCGYLSLKMSIDEIASLTNQTPNSQRVLFHRILKKTEFTTGKELLRALEAIS